MSTPIMQDDNQIRLMTKDEVRDIASAWAAKEGWNPGLYDYASFHATDPKGFYVGLLKGTPIACISAVAYDAQFGFMGFYIVSPEYRNKGYGLRLWNEALKHLPSQNIGLDGVVSQQHNYQKSGFKLAYKNFRFQGSSRKHRVSNSQIVELKDIDFKKLLQFDTQLFPANREIFLQSWIKQPESYAVGSLMKGKLNGYGTIRRCVTGYKIGPLFAGSPEVAEQIFISLSNYLKPGEKFYIDVPEKNQFAIKLVNAYGMLYSFETARMYSKYNPRIDLNKIFGVTSFELG